MKITTAINILEKERNFLGLGFLETLQFIQKNPLAQPQRTLDAYHVFMDEGAKLFALKEEE